MENTSKRENYIDCAKGIAIIIVVAVHSMTNQADLTLTAHVKILRFLTQFAMPTFFFINGFLYSEKYSQRPVWGSVKKIKTYFIPFLKYNLLFLILHNIFAYLHLVDENNGNSFYSFKEYIKHFILVLTGHREYFGGALWFLGSILTVSIIFIVSDYFVTKYIEKYRYVVLFVFAIVGGILGKSGYVPSAMKLSVSCTYFMFFYLGYICKKKNILPRIEKYKYIIILFTVVLLVICANICNIGFYQNIFNVWIYYIIATCGAISVLLLCRMEIVQNNKCINYIGKSSMEIMAFHLLSFKIVSYFCVKYYNLPIERMADYPVIVGVDGIWILLYILIGVSVPVGIKCLNDLVKGLIKYE